MNEVDARIIRAVGDEEGLSFSALKKKSGLSWQAAHEHLEKLVGEGLIRDVRGGFPRTRRLYLTEEGKKAYEGIKRAEAAERAINVDYIIGALRARVKETTSYLEPFLTNAHYAGLIDQFVSSIKSVALTPPPEGEEEEGFIDALLLFLSHLLKHRGFREKVAKERRLTFLLDLDFSSVQLTDEDLRAALFFGLVYQELRREGKV
ncbi:MAG: winged helix-turn-helix transcriptional regulator [Nitrososphaerota archaeon]